MSYNDITGAALVIDHGSERCKIGFGGEDVPRAVFPTITATPKSQDNLKCKDCYIGSDVPNIRESYYIRFPIEHGVISRWDEMELVWHHIFHQELNVNPEERPVLLTELPMNPKIYREKMTEIMFEKFNIPAIFIGVQSVLSLLASGRTTGIVCDSGGGFSHVIPVYEGYGLKAECRKIGTAGRELTDYLRKAMGKKGYNLANRHKPEFDIIRDIKEKLCYVSLDVDKEKSESSTKKESYILPDGEEIILDEERYLCPEILFQPSVDNREMMGLHELLSITISKTDEEIRNDMYRNIVLSGGSTLFSGFAERMLMETRKLAPTSSEVHVDPGQEYSAWKGGSMAASLSTFLSACLTKDEYDEYGPTMVHKKCY